MGDLQYDDRQAYSSVRILFSRVRLDRFGFLLDFAGHLATWTFML